VKKESHNQLQYWTLQRLRENGFATSIARPLPLHDFQQIGTGKLRKVYPASRAQQLHLYRPTRFRGYNFDIPGERLRSAAEIAGEVDSRSLDDLYSQALDSHRQLLIRAAAGDERAMYFLADRVGMAARYLEILEEAQPEKLRALAQQYPRWPVLLSLNPQDIEIARDRLRRLCVGQKALTPTRSGQRVDRRSFWTRLAAWAVDECYNITRTVVPVLEHHAKCAGARPKRVKERLWGTPVEATYYYLPEGVLCLTDWEKQCVHLSKPVTKENFGSWWKAVRGFVREFWHCSASGYATALDHTKTGQHTKTEPERRSMAFDRVEQALRGLTRVK
jgi:hypothetical protein